jgi:dihydropteroate synthase
MSPRGKAVTASAGSVKVGTCTIRFDRTKVMGIVNTTPDSFSGDGLGGDEEAAIARGMMQFEQGADLVDVGGESTRPGAEPVPARLEMARTIGVVEALARARPGRVSIDTMKPEVAKSALLAGATVVNDVSGLRDPEMIEVVAEHGASAIIMHMLGEPRTMQARPRYKDVVRDIIAHLEERVAAAEAGGVEPRRIMVDPGIGFGKTLEHNLEILARLGELKALGKPVVIGVSRKSFIGKITGMPAEKRIGGSVAAAIVAARNGASIVRVHEVRETVDALQVASAVWGRE